MHIDIPPEELKGLYPQKNIEIRNKVLMGKHVKCILNIDCQNLYNIEDVVDAEHTLREYAILSPAQGYSIYPGKEEIIPVVLNDFSHFHEMAAKLNLLLLTEGIEMVKFGCGNLETEDTIGHRTIGGILLEPSVSDEFLSKSICLLQDTCEGISSFISNKYLELILSNYENLRLYGESMANEEELEKSRDEEVRQHAVNWFDLFSAAP
jgi:hypothetical protein